MEGDYKPGEIEDKWRKKWEENQTYKYEEKSDKETYTIDTPPPTVSGSLHFGHTYGNTLADFKARFERMRGKNVFFPFGYDNNGIASERLTEKELGIKHQNYTRREFQEKVREVCKDYEQDFEEIMRKFAFSYDWNNTYKTIEPRVQKISQQSFIELYENDRQYREKSPVIWCPECETAISQVEIEDLEEQSHFNNIEFPLSSGNGSLVISTTRPELLPACVAIFVHPEDEANENLVGEKATVPLFDYDVPILEDERVDMETGTGVVMCCTFGDQTDIEWYQAHDLNLRIAIDESGTLTDKAGKYEGLSTEEAREEIVEDLEQDGKLLDRWRITHAKKVHERCDTPIEFLVKKQWYIKILDKTDEYLEAGKEMDWNPKKMFKRYKNWIEELEWDWCISRQRDSGIPIPVWYHKETGEPVIADTEQLPVDPIQDEPPVDNPEEYKPETDVLDTWATSSLTPLINAGWEEGKINKNIYPMDLRYQGHDIISFWLFHTLVKCYEHTGEVPFKEVMIHGWVLDENREKMSKSVGNVTTPQEVLEDYSVDAARYWSGLSSVGDDLPLKEKDLVSGRKLNRKLWNASKLVNSLAEVDQIDINTEKLDEIDRYMLKKVDTLIEQTTENFENYEFAKARNQVRDVFWNNFCDNYLEIVKQELRNGENRQKAYTLRKIHRTFLKLFAPIMPHITEEIYSQMYSRNDESIHKSNWPEDVGVEANIEEGDNAMEIISAIRKYKTKHQMAPNDEIEKIEIYGELGSYLKPISDVMHIKEIEILEDEPETMRKISEIKLNYENAGPKYGDKIGKIEEALENNEFNLDTGRLVVADEKLKPEMFEVHEEVELKAGGELLETDDLMVIVKK